MKGRPNRAKMGLGRPAWPIPMLVRPPPPFLEYEDDATLRLVALGTPSGAARRAATGNRAVSACTGVLQCQRYRPAPTPSMPILAPPRRWNAHARPTNQDKAREPPTTHLTFARLCRRHPRSPPLSPPSLPSAATTLVAVRDPRDAMYPRRKCGAESGRDRCGSRVAPDLYPHPSPAIAATWDKPSQ
jgi:hypothetical protein